MPPWENMRSAGADVAGMQNSIALSGASHQALTP